LEDYKDKIDLFTSITNEEGEPVEKFMEDPMALLFLLLFHSRGPMPVDGSKPPEVLFVWNKKGRIVNQ